MVKQNQKELQRWYYILAKIQAMNVLGSKCIQCECTDIRCLEIDHIIPINMVVSTLHGKDLYIRIINNNEDIENLQILCSCCHSIKTWKNIDRRDQSKSTIQQKDRRLELREYNRNNKLKAITLLGAKCIQCNCTDIRCLEIDHLIPINTSDKMYRGESIWRKIINGEIIKNIQILCSCCHSIKTWENKERYRS